MLSITYVHYVYKPQICVILSVEEPIVDDGLLREEAIGYPQGPSRLTEEEACIIILFASLRVTVIQGNHSLRTNDDSGGAVGPYEVRSRR
jgi:hypothetical protein